MTALPVCLSLEFRSRAFQVRPQLFHHFLHCGQPLPDFWIFPQLLGIILDLVGQPPNFTAWVMTKMPVTTAAVIKDEISGIKKPVPSILSGLSVLDSQAIIQLSEQFLAAVVLWSWVLGPKFLGSLAGPFHRFPRRRKCVHYWSL
jgi:hypothetical protein